MNVKAFEIYRENGGNPLQFFYGYCSKHGYWVNYERKLEGYLECPLCLENDLVEREKLRKQ